ncbi:hypothetical protein F975_00824 [Acinetobacter sp. ANC 3789]|uniref:lipopolysaccharide biosynthesis protein n=1 Tax=Acinetobacter sp. ANC 3789 TaxID=1217714 RepID=UPI0002D0178B|nr:hypothetical protein [Acinetobacter sp. ANC 3789]ENU80966.1 hypothetical protein F975_00824 [Acinetobacter sp. ANC 3789]
MVSQVNNKTIILNTIFLYIRMLVIIGISLYTTRVIFNVLGVENYGLFNLVSSFVALFSFLNSAMQSGTQRFLNVALSSKNIDKVQITFSTALNIHIVIAAIILLTLETIGLWYLNYQLNIPHDKVVTANIVYQCAVVMTILGIVSVPYQAIIVAKERMSLFAYIGIFEAIAKLLIALVIGYASYNFLVFYSSLLTALSIGMFLLYLMITIRNFRLETKYKFKREAGLTKEILSFSGWNLFGQIAVLSSNQGVTILYNLFLGITVNAALAIGQQVRGLVGTLANNLQMAFNPQIVQSYACGDIEHHNMLVLNASRYSLYLISIIAIPFLLYSDIILQLWLGQNLPAYASYFAKAMIWVTILDCVSGPFWMSAHAKGNIKQYQLVVSAIFLLNLPLTYGLYQFSHSVYVSFFATIGVVGGALIYRVSYFLKGNHLPKKMLYFYFKNISYVLCFLILLYPFLKETSNIILLDSFSDLFLMVGFVEIVFISSVMIFCMNGFERNLLKSFVLKKINRI